MSISNPFYPFLYLLTIPHLLAFKLQGRSKKKLIEEDIIAMNLVRGKHGLSYYLVHSPAYRNLFYYRIGKIACVLRICLPPYVLFDIASRTIIDGGMNVLYHPYASIINAEHIGKNFVIHQCTTIGNKGDNMDDNVPTIGDNVTICAHSIIVGKIKVGNNVVVGAGSVVVKDVPDNTIVAGNPARIIRYL